MADNYQVIPFIGKIKGNQTANDVSDQLESLLNQGESQGLEFVQLGSVNIEVQPGCIGGLMGAKADYTRFDMAIFRRKN